jgi:hypothetical protein
MTDDRVMAAEDTGLSFLHHYEVLITGFQEKLPMSNRRSSRTML